MGGLTTLSWAEPSEPGATQLSYDTVVSGDSADFVTSATCVESNGTDTVAQHTTTPGSGEVFYFLVVAENTCGVGSAGSGSSGTARSVLDCF